MGFFERLKDGLQKTRKNFTERIEVLVGMSAEIDDDFLDELEMILLSADVGAKTTEKLIEAVRQAARKKEIKGTEDVVPFLKKYLTQMLTEEGQRTRISGTPTVILVVGVNGVGKTTTIGKLANYFHLLNYKVMIAAADTFRAAASEQLEIWGKRAGCDVIKHAEGADPAAVVFDAMKAAIAKDGYQWLNLVELNDAQNIWQKYGVGNGGGKTFLVAADGSIVAIAPSADDIKKYIEEHIGKN